MATSGGSETSWCAQLLPTFAYFLREVSPSATQQLAHGHERARRGDLHEVLSGLTTGIRPKGGVQRIAIREVDLGDEVVRRRRAAGASADPRDLDAFDAGPALDDRGVDLLVMLVEHVAVVGSAVDNCELHRHAADVTRGDRLVGEPVGRQARETRSASSALQWSSMPSGSSSTRSGCSASTAPSSCVTRTMAPR